MCWWAAGFWWPGLALMAVFMVICMVLMARMVGSIGGMGAWGHGRWREARDRAGADERTPGDRPGTDIDAPDERRDSAHDAGVSSGAGVRPFHRWAPRETVRRSYGRGSYEVLDPARDLVAGRVNPVDVHPRPEVARTAGRIP
jgi:hypothetical protein